MAASDGGHVWPGRASDLRIQEIAASGKTDAVFAALRTAGYTGSIDDMWKQHLAALGITDTSEPFTDGLSASTDDNYSSVVVLSDCEGADAATTLTGQGPAARTFTFSGSTAISDAQAKFGSTSLYSDATAGDIVSVANAAAFDIGTDAFTFECHWRPDNTSQTGVLAGHWSLDENSRSWVLAQAGAVCRVILQNGPTGTTNTQNTGNVFTAATWHHIAIVKTGVTLYIFIDGVAEVNGVDTGITELEIQEENFELFDALNQPAPAAGYMDNIRLTIGVARYTEAFTPPTEAYPTS
jgi:hypothetical protein